MRLTSSRSRLIITADEVVMDHSASAFRLLRAGVPANRRTHTKNESAKIVVKG
jgi:hypothetical protein